MELNSTKLRIQHENPLLELRNNIEYANRNSSIKTWPEIVQVYILIFLHNKMHLFYPDCTVARWINYIRENPGLNKRQLKKSIVQQEDNQAFYLLDWMKQVSLLKYDSGWCITSLADAVMDILKK